MKWLLYFLATLLVAITAGTIIGRDPGRLLLTWGGWTLETSATFFAAALLIGMTLVHIGLNLLRKLLRLPELIRRWRGERRALQAEEMLARGLQSMLAGEWRMAERDFKRWAARGCNPALGYLYAARTADAQGAERRRDHYLQQAAAASRDARSLTLARAELLPDLPQARADLEQLAATDTDAAALPRVRRLQLTAAMDRGAWADAQHLFAVMQKAGDLAAGTDRELELHIAAGNLTDAGGEEALKAAWSELASGQRRDPGLIAHYVRLRLRLRHGPSPDCESLLSHALSKGWDPVLAALFGRVEGGNPERQLRIAEGWLKRQGRDAELLLTLGRLARRAGQLDQAKAWLVESLGLRPGAEACHELGLLLEQQGDTAGALKFYREGMTLFPSGS
jgi:HemY protein